MLSSMDHWKERVLILFGILTTSMFYVIFRSSDNVVAFPETEKDSILLGGSVYIILALIGNCVTSIYTQVYGTQDTLSFAFKLAGVFAFFMYTYINVFRWPRLVAKRQNRKVLDIRLMTTSESKFAAVMIPTWLYGIFNGAWALTFSRLAKMPRKEIELYLVIDVVMALVFFTIVSGLFNLELSWRSLDGALATKLRFADILASRSNVTLTIADSTLATSSNSVDAAAVADVEQGIAVESILLEQRDAYLHLDIFRMDQVIRNIVTNAGYMGAMSEGLGCGTTVYFELPLFSAAAAGKPPVNPTIPLNQPLLLDEGNSRHEPVASGDVSSSTATISMRKTRSISILPRDLDSSTSVIPTPERIKPRPSSPPLTGSAIIIGDENSSTDDVGTATSPRILQKPRRGDAWRETESTLADRLSGLPTTTMMPSQAISHVSRVLEYDGKHDDEGPVVASTPSLGEPRQLTLLIVVSADNYVKPFANFC
eukprot:gene23830-30921_t